MSKCPPTLETDEPRPWNGRGSKLGVVVELQCVICGMEYQGWGTDRGNPLIRQCSRIIESTPAERSETGFM